MSRSSSFGAEPALSAPLGTHATRQSTLGRQRRFVIRVRASLYALIVLLAGALLFVFGGLYTIAVLADSHCGPAFGYYGCEAPIVHGRE